MKNDNEINGTLEKNPFYYIKDFAIGSIIHWNVDGDKDNIFLYEIVEEQNNTYTSYNPPTYNAYRSSDFQGALVVSDDPENRRVLLKFEKDLNFISHLYSPGLMATFHDMFRDFILVSYDWLCDAVETRNLHVFSKCNVIGEEADI